MPSVARYLRAAGICAVGLLATSAASANGSAGAGRRESRFELQVLRRTLTRALRRHHELVGSGRPPGEANLLVVAPEKPEMRSVIEQVVARVARATKRPFIRVDSGWVDGELFPDAAGYSRMARPRRHTRYRPTPPASAKAQGEPHQLVAELLGLPRGLASIIDAGGKPDGGIVLLLRGMRRIGQLIEQNDGDPRLPDRLAEGMARLLSGATIRLQHADGRQTPFDTTSLLFVAETQDGGLEQRLSRWWADGGSADDKPSVASSSRRKTAVLARAQQLLDPLRPFAHPKMSPERPEPGLDGFGAVHLLRARLPLLDQLAAVGSESRSDNKVRIEARARRQLRDLTRTALYWRESEESEVRPVPGWVAFDATAMTGNEIPPELWAGPRRLRTRDGHVIDVGQVPIDHVQEQLARRVVEEWEDYQARRDSVGRAAKQLELDLVRDFRDWWTGKRGDEALWVEPELVAPLRKKLESLQLARSELRRRVDAHATAKQKAIFAWRGEQIESLAELSSPPIVDLAAPAPTFPSTMSELWRQAKETSDAILDAGADGATVRLGGQLMVDWLAVRDTTAEHTPGWETSSHRDGDAGLDVAFSLLDSAPPAPKRFMHPSRSNVWRLPKGDRQLIRRNVEGVQFFPFGDSDARPLVLRASAEVNATHQAAIAAGKRLNLVADATVAALLVAPHPGDGRGYFDPPRLAQLRSARRASQMAEQALQRAIALDDAAWTRVIERWVDAGEPNRP